jgi:hypothetical protein
MEGFSLFDEIYGWNRSTDDEAGAPAGKAAPSGQADLLDATRPFGDLFDYTPESGRAVELVRQIRAADRIEKVLGTDVCDALKAVHSATAVALDRRIATVTQRVTDELMTKATRVVAGAPLRKRAITGIVNKFKQELIGKGYSGGVESFGADGWERLASSMESFVTQAVAGA